MYGQNNSFCSAYTISTIKGMEQYIDTRCDHFFCSVEYSVPGNSFAISSDPGVRSRINKGLATLADRVCGEYSNVKSRKRQNLDSKTKLFHIYTGETVSVADLKKENNNIMDDLEKWKKTCENLESDICELYEEIKSVINDKDEQISNLQSINKELKSYINILENSPNLVHTGKHVSEVKKNREH